MSSPQAREAFEISAEPDAVRDRYGRTRFGQSCLLARRLIERGVRFVTVNMFETVFNEITWDIHGSAPFSPIECYKNEVGPNFDNAYTALLEDLRGAAAREHDGGRVRRVRPDAQDQPGRRPRPSPSLLDGPFAGGPIQGGRVVGTSDEIGYAPKDRPVTPAEIAATVYQGLGIDPAPSCPGRRAGRSGWSITASSRSRSCFETRYPPPPRPLAPARTPDAPVVDSIRLDDGSPHDGASPLPVSAPSRAAAVVGPSGRSARPPAVHRRTE